jgi:hypothetical protein
MKVAWNFIFYVGVNSSLHCQPSKNGMATRQRKTKNEKQIKKCR